VIKMIKMNAFISSLHSLKETLRLAFRIRAEQLGEDRHAPHLARTIFPLVTGRVRTTFVCQRVACLHPFLRL